MITSLKESIENLLDLVYNKTDVVINSDNFKSLMQANIKLCGYDFLNKILIYLQNNKASDVKSAYEWQTLGRRVKENALQIGIIIPKTSVEYIDTATGEKISTSDMDMSAFEIKKACESGLLERVEDVDGFDVSIVYDINATEIVDVTKGNLASKQCGITNSISIRDICEIVSKSTGLKIKWAESNKYDSLGNTVYLCADSFENVVKTLAEYTATYFVDNIYSYIQEEASDSSLKFVRNCLAYSICELFNVKYSSDNFGIEKLSGSELLSILHIVDTLMSNVLDNIRYKDIDDKIININKVHEAEKLLNLLVSFDLYTKMKGA